MRETIISLKGVSKEYKLYSHLNVGFKYFLLHPLKSVKELNKNKFKALEDITFDVKKGECLGIIGKNGSGKSTLLSIIAQTIKPTKGIVSVKGKVSPLLELGAGFHPELTGLENIMLNGLLLGMKKREIKSKLDKIIEFSELGDFIYQPIRMYSSGMVARLAFSIAIHINPDILLVDEILAVGDFKFQEKCHKKMKEFKEKGITIILVSHNENDIKSMCDRVILLNKGKKIFDGEVIEGLKLFKGISS